jgi:hypothetical protein
MIRSGLQELIELDNKKILKLGIVSVIRLLQKIKKRVCRGLGVSWDRKCNENQTCQNEL